MSPRTHGYYNRTQNELRARAIGHSVALAALIALSLLGAFSLLGSYAEWRTHQNDVIDAHLSGFCDETNAADADLRRDVCGGAR